MPELKLLSLSVARGLRLSLPTKKELWGSKARLTAKKEDYCQSSLLLNVDTCLNLSTFAKCVTGDVQCLLMTSSNYCALEEIFKFIFLCNQFVHCTFY